MPPPVIPTAPADLSRRDRERLARRSDMLAAARTVFAEKGFVGATLDEIAALAEFGKGTLYNYFPGGKDEILFAVFDEIFSDLQRIVEESFPGGDRATWRQSARGWFRGYIESVFEYFEARREIFLILTRESHRMCFSENEDRVDYFLRQRSRITHALAGPVQSAIDAGAMRPFPVLAVSHMLFGNITGLQLHRALESESSCPMSGGSAAGPDAAQSAEFLSSFLFDGLLIDPQGS